MNENGESGVEIKYRVRNLRSEIDFNGKGVNTHKRTKVAQNAK